MLSVKKYAQLSPIGSVWWYYFKWNSSFKVNKVLCSPLFYLLLVPPFTRTIRTDVTDRAAAICFHLHLLMPMTRWFWSMLHLHKWTGSPFDVTYSHSAKIFPISYIVITTIITWWPSVARWGERQNSMHFKPCMLPTTDISIILSPYCLFASNQKYPPPPKTAVQRSPVEVNLYHVVRLGPNGRRSE